jgi:hypothetical protein
MLQEVAKVREGLEEYRSITELGLGKRTDQERVPKWVYVSRLFIVSARTNKWHHHQTVEDIIYTHSTRTSRDSCLDVGFLHVLSQLGFQQND